MQKMIASETNLLEVLLSLDAATLPNVDKKTTKAPMNITKTNIAKYNNLNSLAYPKI